MPNFKIECIDRDSGLTTILSCKAQSIDAAKEIAIDQGFIVGRVLVDPQSAKERAQEARTLGVSAGDGPHGQSAQAESPQQGRRREADQEGKTGIQYHAVAVEQSITCPSCGAHVLVASRDISEPGGDTQTVELTGKRWKRHQLRSFAMVIGGLVTLWYANANYSQGWSFAIASIGMLTALAGLAWFIAARIMSWWHHG